MKNWAWMLILVAGPLAIFALWPFWQPAEQSSPGAVAIQDTRPVSHRTPAPPARAAAPQPTFGGYPCPSGDCSEDKAGFRWAGDNAIADPDECTGISGAFIEGCRVYAQQRAPRS